MKQLIIALTIITLFLAVGELNSIYNKRVAIGTDTKILEKNKIKQPDVLTRSKDKPLPVPRPSIVQSHATEETESRLVRSKPKPEPLPRPSIVQHCTTDELIYTLARSKPRPEPLPKPSIVT